ncbi:MAG: hypothetical protein IPM42_22285 [Saprospiraceae bacterium]|nr:hypothetical protein [Saprospiraceae bacterium]
MAAHEAAELAKTEIEERENQKRRDARKKDLEDAARIAKQEALSLAQSISDSLFEIEAANNEKVFDAQRARIEKSYENQIKAAQGNTAEVERLEREKAKRLMRSTVNKAKRERKPPLQKRSLIQVWQSLKHLRSWGQLPGPLQLFLSERRQQSK